MTDTVIKNVSDTAFWIAHYRALESQRTDALFHDPLAGVLAGDRGKTIAAAMPRDFVTAWTVVIRTCIIDDYVRSAIREGVDTVLNLGAGLDTRPYRMDVPEHLVWVEADYPRVIELKEERLSNKRPRCRMERLKLNIADISERRKVFARIDGQAERMLVLTEGVVPYLSVQEAGSLADDLKELNHACYWIVDYFAPEIMKYRERHGMNRRMQNAPFKFAPKDWFGFFGEHGWQCKEVRYLADEAERLRRPIKLPPLVKAILKVRGLFASGERRAAFRKFVGYVMLEPSTTLPGNRA